MKWNEYYLILTIVVVFLIIVGAVVYRNEKFEKVSERVVPSALKVNRGVKDIQPQHAAKHLQPLKGKDWSEVKVLGGDKKGKCPFDPEKEGTDKCFGFDGERSRRLCRDVCGQSQSCYEDCIHDCDSKCNDVLKHCGPCQFDPEKEPWKCDQDMWTQCGGRGCNCEWADARCPQCETDCRNKCNETKIERCEKGVCPFNPIEEPEKCISGITQSCEGLCDGNCDNDRCKPCIENCKIRCTKMLPINCNKVEKWCEENCSDGPWSSEQCKISCGKCDEIPAEHGKYGYNCCKNF